VAAGYGARGKADVIDLTRTYENDRSTAAFAGSAHPTALERDDFSSNRHHALTYSWSMIFSENRFPLFRIML
jgi:hypothetical protein